MQCVRITLTLYLKDFNLFVHTQRLNCVGRKRALALEYVLNSSREIRLLLFEMNVASTRNAVFAVLRDGRMRTLCEM